jgi:hypothetical protein
MNQESFAFRRESFNKDIYNKRIATPTSSDPEATTPMTYSIGACVQDHEMMMVILKRFRYLAHQKSQEPGLSDDVQTAFLSWRNSLGETLKPIYMAVQGEIIERRDKFQKTKGISEDDSEASEARYNQEMASFKNYFGGTPLAALNWQATESWSDLLQSRWMASHHL